MCTRISRIHRISYMCSRVRPRLGRWH
ncbi:hypothetical protein F383_12719 [Gossypium arboreum]|uniref:Uncharacterized protein n=1 Tax=Gossypium arboreum TaxID=29729 RepID=A0A0B0NFI5_GOSAR|nr:hypothetical protein F383_12719 [Gossypium arboreum]